MVSASFLCRPWRFGCQSERFDLPLHSANRNRMNRTATLRKWIPQYKANLALAGPVVAVGLFVVGFCGGGAMLAFDGAKSANEAHRSGAASGVVNMGGFLAGVLIQLLVGAVYQDGAFRLYAMDPAQLTFAPVADTAPVPSPLTVDDALAQS